MSHFERSVLCFLFYVRCSRMINDFPSFQRPFLVPASDSMPCREDGFALAAT